MIYYGKSDIGNTRPANEDAFLIKQIADNAIVVAVCDGMGGLDCGDVASSIAVSAFVSVVERLTAQFIKKDKLKLNEKEAYLILSNAVTVANNKVIAKQEEINISEGMGTTLISALIIDGGKQISWANIGDSRIYTIDSKDILQVSKDHSYIQYMVDMGRLTLEESKKSKKKNLITKAIGIDDKCEPDIDTFMLSPDEVADTHVLLCTDGFSNSVEEEECATIVKNTSMSVEEKVNTLIDLAKQNDGSDNITLVLLELG